MFSDVTDGLSNTLLLAETSCELAVADLDVLYFLAYFRARQLRTP